MHPADNSLRVILGFQRPRDRLLSAVRVISNEAANGHTPLVHELRITVSRCLSAFA